MPKAPRGTGTALAPPWARAELCSSVSPLPLTVINPGREGHPGGGTVASMLDLEA